VGLCQDADFPAEFPATAVVLGAAYTLAGRVADAVSLLTQAMEQTIAMERVGPKANCSLSLGEAQMQAGRLEEAHALALAEELGMHPLTAHCHLSLGVLYQRVGKREPAQAALSTAIELLRAMEMIFWLPRAEAALAKVA
jgi:tetratricopeptide (TPR) repeat protein